MKWNVALLFAGIVLFPSADVFAQQPGSVQYNTVTLPAMMAAQRSGRLAPPSDRWGAIAIGEGQSYGWMDKAGSEDEAKAAALTDCRAKGGGDCVVETVFANACAVLAAGSAGHIIASAPPAERTLDRSHELLSNRRSPLVKRNIQGKFPPKGWTLLSPFLPASPSHPRIPTATELSAPAANTPHE